jgi:hypothetical protein
MKDNNLRGVFPALFGPNGAELFNEIFEWIDNSLGIRTAVINLEQYGIVGDTRSDINAHEVLERIANNYSNGTTLVQKKNTKYNVVYLTKYGFNGRGSQLDAADLDKKSHWFFALFKEFDSREKNSVLAPPLGKCCTMIAMRHTMKELNYHINKDLTPDEEELDTPRGKDYTANDTLIIIKAGSYYYLYRIYKNRKQLFDVLDSLDIKYKRVKN